MVDVEMGLWSTGCLKGLEPEAGAALHESWALAHRFLSNGVDVGDFWCQVHRCWEREPEAAGAALHESWVWAHRFLSVGVLL